MKKQLILLIIGSLLLSCTKEKKMPKENNKNEVTESKTVTKDLVVPINKKTIETEDHNYKYKFSNDSIIKILYLKTGTPNKEYQVPSTLKFKLVLQDKFKLNPDKIYDGVAVLTSPNESFSNKRDKDGGDYFAADYLFNIKDCSLKIRLDIENYEACLLFTTCTDLKVFFKNDSDVLEMQ
jgi:hypothetical protein